MSRKLSSRTITLLFVVVAFFTYIASSRTPDDLLRNIPLFLVLAAIPVIGYILIRWKGIAIQ